MRIAASGLATLLVTIVSGTILFCIQTKEPILIYEVTESKSFEGAHENVAIYDLSIVNIGAKPVVNLRSIIRIPEATIVDVRFNVEPTLQHKYRIKVDTLEVWAEEITPHERIVLSLLATSNRRLPGSPQVFVRGGGVTGVSRSSWKQRGILDCLLRFP